jgi:hypothetical protein
METMTEQILLADPEATTTLAAYLNAAMARSPEARAAYAAIYGESWSPLGCGAEIWDGPSTHTRTVR